ncbi:MAG: DNA gyrase inhibitor YacG [Pseudomonadota bacterium]
MSAPRVHCPTCKREVEWNPLSVWRPFCSERCKLIDLGAWFSDERSIPDDAAMQQEDELEPE